MAVLTQMPIWAFVLGVCLLGLLTMLAAAAGLLLWGRPPLRSS